MKKRLFSALLALIMLISVGSVVVSADSNFPAYNASKPSLVIGTANYTGRGNVVVPVTVSRNPGLWGMNFQIKYDSSLDFVAPASGKINDGCYVLTGFCKYTVSTSDRVITVYIDASDFTNSNTNGNVLKLTFKPKTYRSGTTYPVSFTYVDRKSFINANGEDVELTFKDGGVKCVTVPAQPRVSSATVTAAKTVKVSWAKAANAVTYKIERRIGSGKWTTLSTSVRTTSYTDKKATAGGTYQYRVTSINAGIVSAVSAAKSVKVMAYTAKPTIKASGAKKALTVKVSKKVTNASGYQYQVALKSNMKGAKAYTSTKIKKLKAKKTYYVRARAYQKVGSKKFYGAWSKTVKAKTK